MDTISAVGKAPKYSKQVNGINKSIIQLRGKTNELERNVEETRSEIKDVESGLNTKITQTAGKIELEAQRATEAEGNLSSKISQTAEQITSEVTRAQGEESKLFSRISQTAESITAEVTRAQGVETDLAAVISVQADQITAKVSKGDVSSQLSIESGQVSISGDRFVLDSTNFSISADGKVTAKSIDIQGGSVNIVTSSQSYDVIRLRNSSGGYCGMDSYGLSVHYGGTTTTIGGNGSYFGAFLNSPTIYTDTISARSTAGDITIMNDVKFQGDTELGIGASHTIRGSLNINVSSLTITSPSLEISPTGSISVGAALKYLGFFGMQGATKKTVSKVSTPSASTTAYSVAVVLNNLISALQAYSLIG